MREIDFLLSLAYVFEIIINWFVSQYQNFLMWEHLRRNLSCYMYVWCPFSINVRCYFFTWWNIDLIFVCALFLSFRPTREFFTHMETSPLPVKGCKFWLVLGTHGHWAVRGACHTYCDTGHPFEDGHRFIAIFHSSNILSWFS